MQKNLAPYSTPKTSTLPAVPHADAAEEETSRCQGFGLRLGKLAISLETEEPEHDAEKLARLALERFDRIRRDHFSSELEIAQLRASLTQDTEPPADLESQAPTLSSRRGAQLYAEAEMSRYYARFRPGTLLGVI